ncbi:flagellar export protein FliJ [Metallumcola ferriviriculae]|uniref:Flagellar FliJ protein n=1 Tax=Metallumcola ferriviriculae TaxID=3039180 RepID=A0AAU0UUL7_9FIRM|nr:flagellar export protein FliJ [Desulfitibacteraceae bacterium MK1]
MFHFRLQKVLDYKSFVEDEKKLRLGEANQMRLQEEEKLEGFKQEKRSNQINTHGSIDIAALSQRHRFLAVMDERIKHQYQNLLQAEDAIRQKQTELADAVRERKVFDKIKERRREQYEYEQNLRELKLMDEVATASFVRRKG